MVARIFIPILWLILALANPIHGIRQTPTAPSSIKATHYLRLIAEHYRISTYAKLEDLVRQIITHYHLAPLATTQLMMTSIIINTYTAARTTQHTITNKNLAIQTITHLDNVAHQLTNDKIKDRVRTVLWYTTIGCAISITAYTLYKLYQTIQTCQQQANRITNLVDQCEKSMKQGEANTERHEKLQSTMQDCLTSLALHKETCDAMQQKLHTLSATQQQEIQATRETVAASIHKLHEVLTQQANIFTQGLESIAQHINAIPEEDKNQSWWTKSFEIDVDKIIRGIRNATDLANAVNNFSSATQERTDPMHNTNNQKKHYTLEELQARINALNS